MDVIAVVTSGTKHSRNVARRKVSNEEISASGTVNTFMRVLTGERGDKIL